MPQFLCNLQGILACAVLGASYLCNPSSEMASEMRTLAPKWEAAYRQKNSDNGMHVQNPSLSQPSREGFSVSQHSDPHTQLRLTPDRV